MTIKVGEKNETLDIINFDLHYFFSKGSSYYKCTACI